MVVRVEQVYDNDIPGHLGIDSDSGLDLHLLRRHVT